MGAPRTELHSGKVLQDVPGREHQRTGFKELEEPLGGYTRTSVHRDLWLMRQDSWKEA